MLAHMVRSSRIVVGRIEVDLGAVQDVQIGLRRSMRLMEVVE